MQSDDLFPTLPGRTWSLKTTPMWATGIQTAQSLREVRISYASSPVYTLTLAYDFLRAGTARGDAVRNELDTLDDFYFARAGRAQSFLFRHWYDTGLRDELLGVGDGVRRSFPFGRTRRGRFEAVWWVDPGAPFLIGQLMWSAVPSTAMWAADPTKPMWSAAFETSGAVVGNGQLTLPYAPAAGQPVRASASFFYRARFDADELEFENFMQGLWKPNNLKLRATLGGKL